MSLKYNGLTQSVKHGNVVYRMTVLLKRGKGIKLYKENVSHSIFVNIGKPMFCSIFSNKSKEQIFLEMIKSSPTQQSSSIEEDLTMSPNLKYYNRLPNSTRMEASKTPNKIMCIKWPPSTKYIRGLLIRIATLIVIIGVLIGIGLGLLYTDGMPDSEDFTHLDFRLIPAIT
ncbi:hypothetical protein K501DRAFT_302632 [Backusella circina FSU 941]|nr:hypothetical protein K501DRAFT_302632 [Backusella circina FSU 941]